MVPYLNILIVMVCINEKRLNYVMLCYVSWKQSHGIMDIISLQKETYFQRHWIVIHLCFWDIAFTKKQEHWCGKNSLTWTDHTGFIFSCISKRYVLSYLLYIFGLHCWLRPLWHCLSETLLKNDNISGCLLTTAIKAT